jgi:tetratricopeptide (TPR) repeat protein
LKKEKNIVAIERLQSREEQDQQLNQTASPNKDRGVRDFCMHQCQLNDIQQQRKGKELALAEGKDLSNVDEDGKLVKKQIVLSEHYDNKDNTGLAGGGVGNAFESILDFSVNFADFVSNIIPEPIAKSAMTAIKTVLQMIQSNKDHQERAAIREELDRLIRCHYNIASRLLRNVNLMQKRDNIKKTLDASAEFFETAIEVEKDGFIRTASMFYAGVCYELRREPVVAIQYFEEAYNTGKDQLTQTTEAIDAMKWNPFKQEKRADMKKQLQDFKKFMEYINERKKHLNMQIKNSSFASTSDNAAVDLRPRSRIPKSKKAIEIIYASGEEHMQAKRYEEARDDFDRVIAMDKGYSGAYAYRGAAYLGLGQLDLALADLNHAHGMDKKNTYALKHRGVVYRKKGLYEEALADFKQVCALGHSRPWIEAEIKLIEVKMGGGSYSNDESSKASVYRLEVGR